MASTKPVVIGVDVGTADSVVAYVGKGVVDIVQNEVSARKTPSLVSFTEQERLLGDQALASINSNAKNTCRNFKHILGFPQDSENAEREKFWSLCELGTSEEGLAGYEVQYKDQRRCFSASETLSMFLFKLREITESWCQGKVTDVVFAVPSYFADVHRQALLDAAKIANMPCLRLMNEHTATALAYGIYRSNDFDAEKPLTVAFCSVGHAIFSVAIVQFVKGKLTVVSEASDFAGGRDMNLLIMKVFAEQFKKKTGCDVFKNKKACFKLETAVEKTKKVLSANSEASISVECLMEDEDFSSNMNRDDLETMCADMMAKVTAVIDQALAKSGLSVEQIDSVEMCGGASRVPWVKKLCSERFGGKELMTTLNADECVARGCALQAAILSPLFKVREFTVEDLTKIPISVSWMGSGSAATEAETQNAEVDGDAVMQQAGNENEFKSAVVFPERSMMNMLKVLTFHRKGPFDVKAQYADTTLLPAGTPAELGSYRVELPPQQENKKVKVKARMSLHGTFVLETAQMVEDEEYEETVKEQREIPQEEGPEPPREEAGKDEQMPPAEASAAETVPGGETAAAPPAAVGEEPKKEDEAVGAEEKKEAGAEEKKEEKKPEPKQPKYEWVEVKKKKKRTKRTDLKVTSTGVAGLSEKIIQQRKDAESAMQSETIELRETSERRNDLESYVLDMRTKIQEGEIYGPFITPQDREALTAELQKAEDWLYDNFEGTKVMFVEKLHELAKKGNPYVLREQEAASRDDWCEALRGTIVNYKIAVTADEEKYEHIAPEKLQSIAARCDEADAWLTDMMAQQAALPKTQDPILKCVEMEKRNKELADFSDKILSEPKPKPPPPPKEEKKEEKKEDASANAASAKGEENPATAEGEAAAAQESPQPVATDDMDVE